VRAIYSSSARQLCKTTPKNSQQCTTTLTSEARAARVEALRAVLSAPAWSKAKLLLQQELDRP